MRAYVYTVQLQFVFPCNKKKDIGMGDVYVVFGHHPCPVSIPTFLHSATPTSFFFFNVLQLASGKSQLSSQYEPILTGKSTNCAAQFEIAHIAKMRGTYIRVLKCAEPTYVYSPEERLRMSNESIESSVQRIQYNVTTVASLPSSQTPMLSWRLVVIAPVPVW